jgi:hypothetical protein
MSKLVGALLLELAEDVPDHAGLETVRADLMAASIVYESGKKKDLALRFYLAIRSLFHEIERMEKESSKRKDAAAGSFEQPNNPQPEHSHDNYSQPNEPHYQN